MFVTIDFGDLVAIGFLVFLEGVLSVDNAVVLATMVRHLPAKERARALTYGMWGAFAFRVISLLGLSYILGFWWIKIAGGAYLVYTAAKHFVGGPSDTQEATRANGWNFWRVVLAVELMDVAFSVDSILAAASLTQKLWVVVFGGCVGIVMMRMAAFMFVRLLEQNPHLERVAYVLVLIIGLKLGVQGCEVPGVDFHSAHNPASWVFWGLMAVTVAWGALSLRRPALAAQN